MWKIIVAFIVFAALAMFVIMKGGDQLDMGGEKHGADAVHAPEAPASAAAPAAPAAVPAEPAASAAK
ncbi:MAG: hypothetical protein HY068_09760 [Burkholderiales bacterium]|nr:hypothetical protein [Burkholderiales bacterium]